MEYNRNYDLRPIVERDQCALATYSGYWFKKINDAATADDYQRFDEINESEKKIRKYIEQHTPTGLNLIGVADVLDDLFAKIHFHDETNGGNSFSDLNYLGLHSQGVESLWKDLSGLAQYYRKFQKSSLVDQATFKDTIDQRKNLRKDILVDLDKESKGFFTNNRTAVEAATAEFYQGRSLMSPSVTDAAELKASLSKITEQALAQAAGVSVEHLPLPYSLFADPELQGIIPPQFARLVQFNRTILEGKAVYFYCCPNYETSQRADGIKEYTFGSLGTGIGLTAERGFPFINKLLARATDLRQKGVLPHPISLRIGIADYEATPDNAALVGLTPDQFKQNLGKSVENMIDNLTTRIHQSINHGAHYRVNRVNEAHEPIGEWDIHLRDPQRELAKISIGAITKTHPSDIPFKDQVAAKRQELERRAQTDPDFQNQLDGLLKLRLGLMLRWRDGNEPIKVTELGEIFDQVSQSGQTSHINGEYQALVDEMVSVHANATYTAAEKNIVYKAVIVNWMRRHQHIPEVSQAVSFLRQKIAQQGAEYAVMTETKIAHGGGAQIVADSANMWEVFGNKSIPVIAFRGGYEGAN